MIAMSNGVGRRILSPWVRIAMPLLAAALLAAGCGEDSESGDEQLVAPVEEIRERGDYPYVSFNEIQELIDSQIAIVVQGLQGASIGSELEPEPVDLARFEARTGREFDIAIFATPRAAQAALPSARDTEIVQEGGAVTRAANVLAVFPDPPDEVATYRVVDRLMDRLAAACDDRGGDEALRRLCFDDPDLPGPPGTGTDPEELAPAGSTVHVGGLAYTPQVARQLNPNIQPDEAFLEGREPPGTDQVWFGVFLRVCNERGERTLTPTDGMSLVGAFGREVRPTSVPGDEDFAYQPELLEPEECLPPPGSVADRIIEGALVLFAVPVDFLDERPVALEITTDAGERARVALDV